MENVIKELEHLARELRVRDEALSIVVRDAGKETQESFERVIYAIHKMHNFVATLPEKLVKLAETLKNHD